MASNVAKSLGKITATAGTPARITGNESDATARVQCHSISIQALAANTGKVYVCDRSNAVKATGVGVLHVLNTPPTTGAIPSFSMSDAITPNSLNAADFYIDVDTNAEGCIVSILVT